MMETRALGKTGLRVSAIGMGCVQIASSRTDVAVAIIRRALELGIIYFDAARTYGDAEVKLGLALEGARDEIVLSTKTTGRTRDDTWQQITESLERLRTDFLDNCHLHALRLGDDMDLRLGAGGALEALLEARDQGLIRCIGLSSHRSDAAIAALDRFDFDVILIPMNVVEREPLDELIPLCQERGVAVTVMKPLATGLLPARLALKWLLNQPVACIVPGITTLEELEEDAAVGCEPYALTAQEELEVAEVRAALEHARCRLCADCRPCPQDIPVDLILGTDVVYDHYRTMGPDRFRAFPWSDERIARELPSRRARIAQIESCTRCGACEARCPHGLPAMEMLQATLPAMRDMVAILEALQPGT
jgi:uncharacterized protein